MRYMEGIVKVRRPWIKQPRKAYSLDSIKQARKKVNDIYGGNGVDGWGDSYNPDTLYIRKRRNANGRHTYYYSKKDREEQPSYWVYFNPKYARKRK